MVTVHLLSVLALFARVSSNSPCQPTLWNAVPPVLNHVAVIRDEEECATVGQVYLHTNQTCVLVSLFSVSGLFYFSKMIEEHKPSVWPGK